MIEVNSLSKSFGSKQAVNNLSFSVRQGEVLGFLGPNGAGKSTTMRMITGFLPPTSGSVKVAQGITEIHIVGGLHPSLPYSFYLEMLRSLAALEPRPLPKGIFLWISISMPRSLLPRWRRSAWAETPAVFFFESRGRRPSSPVILVMRRPGVVEKRATISSPGASMQKPSTSKPQATLATVAGEKIRTSLSG